MNNKCYYINKKSIGGDVVFIDYSRLKGFNIKPRNNVKYDGIVVNKMIIVKPTMIEKLLKRKIKNKLDLYFKLIVKVIDNSDDTDGEVLREALNDLSRYKNIIEYKYRKYLDDKYINLLKKKISLLERELKAKIVYKTMNNPRPIYEEKGKSR